MSLCHILRSAMRLQIISVEKIVVTNANGQILTASSPLSQQPFVYQTEHRFKFQNNVFGGGVTFHAAMHQQ
jgi:hypothetical protein